MRQNVEIENHWVSTRRAAKLLDVATKRVPQVVDGKGVRSRVLPFGNSRTSTEYHLGDLNALIATYLEPVR